MEDKNTDDLNEQPKENNPNQNTDTNSDQEKKDTTENGGSHPWETLDEDPTRIKIESNLGELATGTLDFIKATLSLRHGKYNYREILAQTRENVVFEGYNVWILICSIVVASIGLNMDSVAVVIGAMLISPLMGPIRGIGFGVGMNDFPLLMTSFKNYGVMVGISLVTSVIYFLLSPIDIANAQLLGRTEPNFLDAMIAFFGGLAGIIASSNGKTDTVVSGVAIATALMPPLCTAGWGIANGEWTYFLGASYLFLLNSLFIALSTVVLLRYLRFPRREYVSERVERRVQLYIVIFLIIILTPSGYLFYRMAKKNTFEEHVNEFVTEVIETSEQGMQVDVKPQFDFDESVITISVFNTFVDSSTIERWNRQKVNYELEDARIEVKQGKDFMAFMDKRINEALGIASGNDHLAKLLSEKEVRIAQIQQEFDQYRLNKEKTKDPLDIDYLLKGFKEEYEELKDIAINREFVYNEQNQLDTTYSISVSFKNGISSVEQTDVKKRISKRFCFDLKEKTGYKPDTVRVVNF